MPGQQQQRRQKDDGELDRMRGCGRGPGGRGGLHNGELGQDVLAQQGHPHGQVYLQTSRRRRRVSGADLQTFVQDVALAPHTPLERQVLARGAMMKLEQRGGRLRLQKY